MRSLRLSSTRPRHLLPAPPSAALLLLLPLLAVSPARAQRVVYVSGEPPEADSVTVWTEQAKAGFRAATGDSATGGNYLAYENVGLIGRRLLRARGGPRLVLARAIQPALDSLGFETTVATDLESPGFALLVVRNAERRTAEAVGFLYWYRVDDLRMQAVVLRGGHRPRMRVWRTSRREYPYEWGIVEETRAGLLRFMMLRLSPGGTVWGIQQDEERYPLLGEPGDVQWPDLNADGQPELVSWTRGPTDSLFTECPDCPRLITERTFVEGRDGFDLLEERLLPTPYATLVYFVRLLVDGKLTQAQRLVRDPARVREAVAQGWNRRVVRTPWFVEQGEEGEAWPRRLGLRFQGPNGVKRYGIVFGQREGHWIIENWFEPRMAQRRFPSVTLPSAPGTKAPAEKPKVPPPTTPRR